jgi:hypothetical protein
MREEAITDARRGGSVRGASRESFAFRRAAASPRTDHRGATPPLGPRATRRAGRVARPCPSPIVPVQCPRNSGSRTMGRSFALTVIVTVTLGSLAGCIAHSARPSCAQDRNEGVRPTIDILNSGRDSNQSSQGRDSEVVYLIDRANREAPSRNFRKRVDSLQRPPVRFVLVQWFHAKAGFSQYYNRFDGRLGHPREMN